MVTPQQAVYAARVEQKRRWLGFRLKLYAFAAIAALFGIGAFYALRESDRFYISDVRVIGVTDEAARELRGIAELSAHTSFIGKLFGPMNFFAWPNNLVVSDPAYASVEITKSFFKRSVVITAKPRTRSGIWCVPQEAEAELCWWFDDRDGVVLGRAPGSVGQLIVRVHETEPHSIAVGEPVLREPIFSRFTAITDALRAAEIAVREFFLSQAAFELTAVTHAGTRIVFSLRFDATTASIPALRQFLAKTPLKMLQYIDLTVERKMYVKRR
jgi:hypothetical protein